MSIQPTSETQAAWFCVRSQPKHEHIAAGHLRALPELQVFLPRIRFRRQTRRGAAWFTEALFPNYLFARFDWETLLRRVHAAPGVSGVIHFGERWPTVPDEVMAELDMNRRGFLLNQINGAHQSILTSTDQEMFTTEFRAHARLLKVVKGRIEG